MQPLFHIARVADWEQAQRDGAYRVSTLGRPLDEVGFIHLSFAHQVKTVADAFYRGMPDLVLLELDPERVKDAVRIEAGAGTTEQFPHLYGELELDAVQAVHELRPRPDGTFESLA